ncbi:ABC transporter permease [Patescibacteria group bacterium]|nr:ABC transporter permease [Patescibacteria group bacterium]
MKLPRILAISKKQFQTLRHDKRTLALMLIAPILAMVVFGYAFGTGNKHAKVMVINQDCGATAQKIIDHFDTDTLSITYNNDTAAAKQSVRNGNAVAAIIFPPSFTADSHPVGPRPPQGAHLELYLDSTEAQQAPLVSSQIATALQDYAKDQEAVSAFAVDTGYAFPAAKNATFIDSFLPGIMAFAVTLFTILLTLLAFVGERTSGTMDRLRITPVTETEIVLGYELAFGIIAAIQASLMLLVATLAYHVLVVGSIWLAALIVILVAVDAQSLGILLSAAAQREGQAVQFLPIIIFPVFLLSGIFVPLQSLPDWLRPLAYILPPTWGIQGLRDVMLRGWEISQIWPILLVLLSFAIVFSYLSIVGLKRARN